MKQQLPDYYAVLNVSEDADALTIKLAYRKLVLEWHPDRHQGRQCVVQEAKIREINVAYEVLNDPSQRKIYDLRTGKGSKKPMHSLLADMDETLALAQRLLGLLASRTPAAETPQAAPPPIAAEPLTVAQGDSSTAAGSDSGKLNHATCINKGSQKRDDFPVSANHRSQEPSSPVKKENVAGAEPEVSYLVYLVRAATFVAATQEPPKKDQENWRDAEASWYAEGRFEKASVGSDVTNSSAKRHRRRRWRNVRR